MGQGMGNTLRRLSSRKQKVEPTCDFADGVTPTAQASEKSADSLKGSSAGDRQSTKDSQPSSDRKSEGPVRATSTRSGHCVEGKRSFDGKGALGTPFPKRPMACKLSAKAWAKLEEIFHKMDPDGSNAVTREEAQMFFKGAFGKLSADAMFNEVDVDQSGAITAEEFVQFWIHVAKNGYKEQDILDELEELLDGGAWVDWKDGRETGKEKAAQFPTRPLLCRLSAKTWKKAEELFKKIDTDNALVIDKDKAAKHFKGTFTNVSVDAMFNEMDPKHHGQIPAKEWMKFWIQVKTSGYKENDIIDELDSLLEGGAWVDWKDGRSTA